MLLDVYGTLVRDDGTWEAEAASLVGGLAGIDAAVVAGEWTARFWALADAAHGADFRPLAELTVDSLEQTATHFGVRVDARELAERREPRPPLFPDSLPFLATLDVPVCLVSDADRDRLAALLDHHRITVDSVVTSEDARAYKPRPEPFRLALRRLGLTAADVIHVGDSPESDVAGAAALGIATAFLQRDDRALPPGLAATYTVKTLTALLFALGC